MTVDPAVVVLRLAARTLPERQAEWGAAMCAELTGLVDPAERRRFAVGCTLALLRRPAALVAVAQRLMELSLLATAVALACAIDVPRTRVEALAVVAAFVLGLALLRSRIAFGPVAAGRSARLLAAFGALTAAVEVMGEFRRLRVDPPLMLPMDAAVGVFDPARAGADLLGLTIVLGIFLVGLARVTASRSAARPSTLAAAVVAAALGVGTWLVSVLIHPAAASSVLPALVAVAVAALLAGGLVHRFEVLGGQQPSPAHRRQGVIAGLVAALCSTAAIAVLMDLLPLNGRWVANNAAPVFAAPPPTRVTETFGVWLACVLVSVAAAATVRRLPAQTKSPQAVDATSCTT